VLAQAQDTGVQVHDLPLLGQCMELWGETLHVIVIVVDEVLYNTVQILHADWGRH
jgi:hypothetical protein